MNRLEYLDQMKGIAIFLMVMGHVLLFTFDVNNCTLSNVFFINMPIFFYVSGYLLYKEIDNRRDFVERIKHKAYRLLPPWLAISLVTVWVYEWNFFSTFCIFYWFFYVLFLLTILVLFIDYLMFRHIKNAIAYCVALLLIPILFACQKYSGFYDGYLPAHYLSLYSFPFLLGWVCRKYSRINTFMIENQWLYIVCTAAFFYCWYKFPELNNYVHLLAALGGIIVLQSVLFHSEQKGLRMSIVSRVGRSTLAIYSLNYMLLPDLTNLIGGVSL